MTEVRWRSRWRLRQEGVFVNSVGCEAVERARLHGNAFCVTVGLLCEVERLQHPESCKASTSHQSWVIQSTFHLLSRHSPGDVNPFRKISGHAETLAETLLTQTAVDGSRHWLPGSLADLHEVAVSQIKLIRFSLIVSKASKSSTTKTCLSLGLVAISCNSLKSTSATPMAKTL